MTQSHFHMPSIRALIAFEAAARHNNFSRAAEELHTSQSAISRHVAELEAVSGAPLFFRERQRVRLTDQGEFFLRAVSSGLQTIRSALRTISAWAPEDQVTIASSHEVSHFVLLHRFAELQAAAGDNAQVRIMTFEYDELESVTDPRIDIVLSYKSLRVASEGQVVVVREAARPVCSPVFARANKKVLSQDYQAWMALPFLCLDQPNKGWATWDEWFGCNGIAFTAGNLIHFESYVYLLEAASAGQGIALGWHGYIERHINAGALVSLAPEFVAFDRALWASATLRGIANKSAMRVLDLMSSWNAGEVIKEPWL